MVTGFLTKALDRKKKSGYSDKVHVISGRLSVVKDFGMISCPVETALNS